VISKFCISYKLHLLYLIIVFFNNLKYSGFL